MDQAPNLSDKHELFCQEYVTDMNGTNAAIRAGYAASSAHVTANRLLRNDKVAARISELKAIRAEETGLTASMVVKQLMNIAFADIRNVISFGPGHVVLKDSADLTPEQAAAISEITVRSRRIVGEEDRPDVVIETTKVKLSDKLPALDKLGQYLAMWIQKVEHSGSIGFVNELASLPQEELDRQLAEAQSRKA